MIPHQRVFGRELDRAVEQLQRLVVLHVPFPNLSVPGAPAAVSNVIVVMLA